MARVTIAPGGDYHLGSGESDWALPIGRALSDGHRWLVLPSGNYGMFSGVNLDNWAIPALPSQSLRMEGAGPHLTNITRHASVILFQSSGMQEWRLFMEGITCNGLGGAGWERQDDLPLCDFKRVRYSLFKNCAFIGSGGGNSIGATGLEIGTGVPPSGQQHYAHSVMFVNCQMDDNRDSGIRLGESSNIGMWSSFVQRNARTPFAGGARRAGFDCEFAADGGAGLLIGAHLELNGLDGEWGVRLSGAARAVRIGNSYTYYSVTRLEATATTCLYENNLQVVHPGEPVPINDLGSGNVLRHNVTVSS
jgi:hypothetical protein